MNKILITGGSGNLGAAVANELTSENGPKNISVLVRNPSKAVMLREKGIEILQGDYDDYNSLVKAFKGIDKLYFVSGSDVMIRKGQHENVIKAAKETRVGHLVYTSFQRRTDNETSPIALVISAHLFTEKLIRASGLTFTIMKHALYSDGLPMLLGDQVLNSGVIFVPAGDGKASWASRSDMASAAVSVLTGEGHNNKTYEISADKSYSFFDIAAILSQLSGKQITYTAPDIVTYSAAMSEKGVPAEAIQGMASFCRAIAQGEFDFPDNTLGKLIGRKPQNLKEFLKMAYKL